MLADIFASRYAGVSLWQSVTENERRTLMQAFLILSEQVCPFYVDGNPTEESESFWKSIHSQMARELGLTSLSPLAYAYQTVHSGKQHTKSGVYPIISVCENWFKQAIDNNSTADIYIKDRLSFVEIGFRKKESEISLDNASLEDRAADARFKSSIRPRTGITLPGDPASWLYSKNKKLNENFRAAVDELNERLRRAKFGIHYHNGFFQLSSDSILQKTIEEPFWTLVSDPKWKNVDTDMKEALDLRDSGGRDPAFYAARALESTIKIISDSKGWSHGGEKGAHNYIDNLSSKKNAFIEPWEAEALKSFFTNVRNPIGHGPGQAPMPTLSNEQTNWAIENCMTWTKSLVHRL